MEILGHLAEGSLLISTAQTLLLQEAAVWVPWPRTNFYIDVLLHHVHSVFLDTKLMLNTALRFLVSHGSLFPLTTPSGDKPPCQHPGLEGRDFIVTFYWGYCPLWMRQRFYSFFFTWGSQLCVKFSDALLKAASPVLCLLMKPLTVRVRLRRLRLWVSARPPRAVAEREYYDSGFHFRHYFRHLWIFLSFWWAQLHI